jgi:hypothetical protein
MDLGSINWLAVVVCVVIAMISGFIWYHPKLFYPAWREGIGRSAEMSNPNPMIYVFTLIAALVQAAVVALMVNLMGSTTATAGALAGFMLWLCGADQSRKQVICRAWLQGLGNRSRQSPAQLFTLRRDPRCLALVIIKPKRSLRHSLALPPI